MKGTAEVYEVSRFFTNASAALLAVLLATGAAWAEYKVTTGADSGAGSLREVVKEATQSGTDSIITVDASVKSISLSAQLSINLINLTSKLTIDGGGATVRGAGTHRLLLIQGSGQVEFNSLTFTNGVLDSNPGGAAYIDDATATVTFTNCTFYGNKASSGGAVCVYNQGVGVTKFVNCTITDNKGGGVSVTDGGRAAFTASIITGNTPYDVQIEGQGSITTALYNVAGNVNDLFTSDTNSVGVSASTVFRSATVGDFTLAYPSPAVDKVPAGQGTPAIDALGVSRPMMAQTDAGAFELVPIPLEDVEIVGPDELEVGDVEQYTAKVTPENAYVSLNWSAKDNAVLNVISDDGDTASVDALSYSPESVLTLTANGWEENGKTPFIIPDEKKIKVWNVPTEAPKSVDVTFTKSVASMTLESVDVTFTKSVASMTLDNEATFEVNEATFEVEVSYEPKDARTTVSVDFTSVSPDVASVVSVLSPKSVVVRAHEVGNTIIEAKAVATNSKGPSLPNQVGTPLSVTAPSGGGGTAPSGGGGGGCEFGFGVTTALALLALCLIRFSRR
ncbi:MAG: right-handed parallel beta-helix repeat-containing protein [Synergistaceae bacterium]|nr:right-handed parallel beta-helix repeat-containing protein [Synergistaceae bacterium]